MEHRHIASFAEARDHLREKLDLARSTGRAVMVVNDGEVVGYLVGPEEYDRLVAAEQVVADERMLREGVDQLERGEGRPLREAIDEMKTRLRHGDY